MIEYTNFISLATRRHSSNTRRMCSSSSLFECVTPLHAIHYKDGRLYNMREHVTVFGLPNPSEGLEYYVLVCTTSGHSVIFGHTRPLTREEKETGS